MRQGCQAELRFTLNTFILAQAFNRNHMFIIGCVDHNDALGGASCFPDAINRATNELSAIRTSMI